MESENTINGRNNRKSVLFKWMGLIILVLVLVAAAFVGGQLLNWKVNPIGARTEANIVTAEELPQAQPDAKGIFVRRNDNSFFVGTGNIDYLARSASEPSASHDGPVVEVVVNQETTVFREMYTSDDSGVVEQQVEEGTIEEIGENSQITFWGRKVGDRIIADVLMYYQFNLASIRDAIEDKESSQP